MMYKMFDLTLESDIPLSELQSTDGDESDCTFHLLPSREPDPAPHDWFYHWQLPDEDPWLSFAKQGSDYLLRFPNLADFIVSANGKEVRCCPVPETPLDTIKHLLLDQIIPLVLSEKGKLALHASAVVAPEGAIAFIGMTGQGKSTLAASFSKHGFPVLTDDCLLLEGRKGQIFCLPSYPGLRLWSDSISALFADEPKVRQVAHYTQKKRLGIDNAEIAFCSRAVPLQRTYILPRADGMESVSGITIGALSPRTAFMELVKHTYRIDISDQEKLREEFDYFTRIAALPLFYSLTFPRNLSCLPQVRQAILENLNQR